MSTTAKPCAGHRFVGKIDDAWDMTRNETASAAGQSIRTKKCVPGTRPWRRALDIKRPRELTAGSCKHGCFGSYHAASKA